MQYISLYDSPLGGITIAANEDTLTGLWFNEQKYYPEGITTKYETKDLPIFRETKKWLDLYFSGKNPNFTPKLQLEGSDFRKSVWEILLTIPYGTTLTYGELGDRVARQKGLARMSAQAIGGAVGHNPITLIVPCHRVLGAHQNLTGYAGGLDKKIKLLELEGLDTSTLKRPTKGTAL